MPTKNIPTVLIIYGATGDLMSRKIAPALFNLYKKDKLPKLFRVVAVARRDLTQEDFHQYITDILIKKLDLEKDDAQLKEFLKYILYHQGEFKEENTYLSLARLLGRTDDEWKVCSNKLFYLAVPPDLYEMMFNHLYSSGLTIPCGPDEGWTRVLVEKPFGKDAKTAERVDMLLSKLFKEEQIYRIDHYLGKEMLQNILSFRFSNNLLEQSWNNKFIEKIEIKLLEKIGIEGRGPFYDGLGALVDVGQNHLLQMLALVMMDNPTNLSAEVVRRKRQEILESLCVPSVDEIKKDTFRGQYINYLKIEGVDKKSKTETYFKIKTFLDSPRWQGVPIYLESGKRLKDQVKEIIVTFKHVTPCLCPPDNHSTNQVVFSIEPQEAIRISFLTKKPGLVSTVEVASRNFNFIYRKKTSRVQYVEEYEKLLLDCIEGNQLLFLSTDEVKAMWGYIDPIVSWWKKEIIPLEKYKPETNDILKVAKKIVEGEREVPINILKHKEVGIIGLGKMGANISRQLIEKSWRVIGFNRTKSVTKKIEQEGLIGGYSFEDLIGKLKKPRVIWLMVPHKAIDEIIDEILPYLEKGDIFIEAGNSFYKDTLRRFQRIVKKGINFMDVGVSGGPAGARYGASLMVGGERKDFDYLLPLFIDIAVPGGVQFFPGVGAGHFVKMVHNGIEYGMMQALAEGFTILKKTKYSLDLKKVANVYNKGSVIESRLVGWLENAFKLYGEELENVSGRVKYTGEGKWTVNTAKEMKLKTKIIQDALQFRIDSEKNPSYTGKILSALRNQFGGHDIK